MRPRACSTRKLRALYWLIIEKQWLNRMANPIEDVSAKDAAAIIENESSAVIIDVRSKVEFDYVGHPVGAIHVAWKEYPSWQENAEFCAQVDAALASLGDNAQQRTLLMICRSGARSRAAGEKLLEHGYKNVVNIAEGFEGDKDQNNHRGNLGGWRHYGLPWEQT